MFDGTNHTLISDVDQGIGVWFAWNIQNLLMYHFRVHKSHVNPYNGNSKNNELTITEPPP